MEEKMQVLAKIARVLNQKKVVWSVGGSMLLYFKGITETVQDIDLMIEEKDAETERKPVCYGQSQAPKSKCSI